MKTHRVAVVGCGALAQGRHLPNAQKNPRIELVAACDISRETAEFARDTFGAQRAETDWRKIVEADDIDLCILATHTNLRGEFIVPALEAGKPVYTEKPLAPSLDEMVQIVRASRRTNQPVCVGHNRRSSPAMLEFRRLVNKAKEAPSKLKAAVDRSDKLPHVPEEKSLQILMRVNDDVRSWKEWIFWDREGILFSEMVHFIDIALWLNDAKPVRAFCEGSPRGNFTMVLRFMDGSVTTLQHSMVGNFNYPKELFEATVNFSTVAMDQHLEVRQAGMLDESALKTFPYFFDGGDAPRPGMTGYMQTLGEEMKRVAETDEHPRYLDVYKGHYDHLDRFLTHVEGDGENPCDVESAVVVNRVALKLLESARLGLPVAVGPEDWHIPSR